MAMVPGVWCCGVKRKEGNEKAVLCDEDKVEVGGKGNGKGVMVRSETASRDGKVVE